MKDLLASIAAADGLIDFIFVNTFPPESKSQKYGKKGNFSHDGRKKNISQNKTM